MKKFGALNNPQTEFLKWGKAVVSLKALPCQRKTNRARLLFGNELIQLLPAQKQNHGKPKTPARRPARYIDWQLKIALPDTTKENTQESEPLLKKAKTALIRKRPLPRLARR